MVKIEDVVRVIFVFYTMVFSSYPSKPIIMKIMKIEVAAPKFV